jgi:hypothetical protein
LTEVVRSLLRGEDKDLTQDRVFLREDDDEVRASAPLPARYTNRFSPRLILLIR